MTAPRLVAVLALAGLSLVSGCRREQAPVTVTQGSQLYQCSMHPQIVSREPGTCPICSMKLTPVEPGHLRGSEPHPMPPADARAVPGRAPFTLSPERQQLIGVRRGRVESRDLRRDIRAFGRVAYDPELYGAVVEYREALAARRQLARSPLHEAGRGADAVVRAAALKLRQRGISEEQLARLGEDPVNLLLPGKSVWIYVQVYEYELHLVHAGHEVEISAPAAPGRTWIARIDSVDPILDPKTRTARARVLVETPDRDLSPEMFVTALIRVPLGRVLAVPKDAVLDTGSHQTVFVVEGEGTFEPRAVTLGREAEDAYEVIAGLQPGEEVVTSANFLIDSESRFRAALATFGRPAGGHQH